MHRQRALSFVLSFILAVLLDDDFTLPRVATEAPGILWLAGRTDGGAVCHSRYDIRREGEGINLGPTFVGGGRQRKKVHFWKLLYQMSKGKREV